MTQEYKMCSRCVMDTSDPEITFNVEGVCNHCVGFDEVTSKHWFPNQEGERRLKKMIEQIKASGRGKPYDSILGLSGGVDSSYMALKVHEWGLRPLVMHVDAGWNSELAVANIEKIVKHCAYHLHTHVVDWEEMRDLQLAYLRAGISNQDVPQDHIFFASMYQFAVKHRIKYVLSGGNIATESIFPVAWHGSAMDATNLRAIYRKYGTGKLRYYKTIGFLDYYLWYPLIRGLRMVRPLNFMSYDKEAAVVELSKEIGWRSYGRKHGESIFTKFFQNHYLPVKFCYDKRRPHLSSLIMSGQLSRKEAIEKLAEPLYMPEELERDTEYLCKKLGISRSEFDSLMEVPVCSHLDFPNWEGKRMVVKRGQQLISKMLGRKLAVYS